MSDSTRQPSDPERPWADRIAAPDSPPSSLEEAQVELEKLREVQAHREWVIDGLREHVANIEGNLSTAQQRIAGLETHSANLEGEVEGLAAHIVNLEASVEKHVLYRAELETHIVNLEKRIDRRPLEFPGDGIFPASKYPQLNALFEVGEKIRAEREDLEKRFPADRAADYWYWLLWHGAGGNEDVASRHYPQPDTFLRNRVVGNEMTPDGYSQSGLVNWWTLDGCLRKAGFDALKGGSILDFGAGCGRVLQYFALYSGSCELVGADVDGEAIDWNRSNLDFASFEHLPLAPPTTFESGRFDAIYAFSVFSHLPEALHRSWLEELHRISKPGAAIVLTVQGQHVINAALDGSWKGAFPKGKVLKKGLSALEKSGFAFYPYKKLDYEDTDNKRLKETLDLENYGSTFILEAYVREHWSDLFEIVAYDVSPDDWQDYVVLRRRA